MSITIQVSNFNNHLRVNTNNLVERLPLELKPNNKVCKWYKVCPIKIYVETDKLDRKWIEDYCLIGNKNCVRYQLEEDGDYHPDNLLPNGDFKEDLF